MPVVGHGPALAVAHPRGSEHAHQLFIAASIADFAITLHVAAATTQQLRHTFHRRLRRLQLAWINAHHIGAAAKPRVVDLVEFVRELTAPFRQA